MPKMLLIIASAAAFAGCTIRGTTEPVGYAEVTSVPVDVTYYEERYPRTYYDGRTVYWVDNRWVYRDSGRWYSYRNEPAPLYRYRTTVRQAPPAPRYPSRGPEAPSGTRVR